MTMMLKNLVKVNFRSVSNVYLRIKYQMQDMIRVNWLRFNRETVLYCLQRNKVNRIFISFNQRLRTFAFNCGRLIVSNRSESDIPEYRRTPVLENLLLHGTTFSIVRRGCIARSIALEVRSTLVGTRNITIIIIINLTITILISQPFYPILPDGHPTTLNFMLSLFLKSRFQK